MQLVIQSATNPSAARCRMLVNPSTAWSLNQADRRKARHGFVRGGLLFWGWVCQAKGVLTVHTSAGSSTPARKLRATIGPTPGAVMSSLQVLSLGQPFHCLVQALELLFQNAADFQQGGRSPSVDAELIRATRYCAARIESSHGSDLRPKLRSRPRQVVLRIENLRLHELARCVQHPDFLAPGVLTQTGL